MNDRSTIKAYRAGWPRLSAEELRTEEWKVLAVLLLYGALIFFAIWGVKVLDRDHETPPEPLTVGGAA